MAITIDGDSGVSGVNGSATTPALQGTDSNTGIVFGTDTVQVATGGITRATVDSSGNVGIGTTSLFSATGYGALTLSGSTGGALALAEGSTKRFEIYGDNTNGLRVYDRTNTTERLRVDNSGRLLVGTTTEGLANFGEKLTIADTADCGMTIRSGSSDFGSIYFSDATSGAGEYAGLIEYSHTSDFVRLGTSGTERVRIDNTGRTIMRGTSTNGALVVETSQGAASNKNLIVGGHSASGIDSGTGCFVVLSNGNVVNTNNSYGALSDVKLKENIVDASSQWDDIKAVRVRNYNLKESTGQQTHTQLGVVAQEIETVSAGLVNDSPDLDAEGNDLGTVTKSVNYSVLYMKAVKALQEAQTRIETLETQHADLLARVTALEAA